MDVFLKGKIDELAAVRNERSLVDDAHLLVAHARAEPRLDLRVAEMKEVPGVVPDEAGPLDRFAVAADLSIGFQHEVVAIARKGGGGEPRHAGTNDELAHRIHHPSLLKGERKRNFSRD